MPYTLLILLNLINSMRIDYPRQVYANFFSNTIKPLKEFLKEENTEAKKLFLSKDIDYERLVYHISKIVNNPKIKLYKTYKTRLNKIADCYTNNLYWDSAARNNCTPDKLTNNILKNFNTSLYNIYDLEYTTMSNSLVYSSVIFLKRFGVNVHKSYMENFLKMLTDIENLYDTNNIYYNRVHVAGVLQKIIVLSESFEFVKTFLHSLKQNEVYEMLMKILFLDIMKGESRLKKELSKDDKFANLYGVIDNIDGLIGYTTILVEIEKNYLNDLFFKDITDVINNGNIHKGLFYLPRSSNSNSSKKDSDIDTLIDILEQSVLIGNAFCKYNITQTINTNAINEIMRFGVESFKVYRGIVNRRMNLNVNRRMNLNVNDLLKYLKNQPSLINIINLCELKSKGNAEVNSFKMFITNSSVSLLKSPEFEKAFKETFNNNYFHKEVNNLI
jgi:hypothetical protein